MSVKNLWTKRNILDYLRNPSAELDKNYIPIRQKYRQEFRRMDEQSRSEEYGSQYPSTLCYIQFNL